MPGVAERTLGVSVNCEDGTTIHLGGVDNPFEISEDGTNDDVGVDQCLELQLPIQEQAHSCLYFKVVFTGLAEDILEIAVKNVKFRPYDTVGTNDCGKSSNFY